MFVLTVHPSGQLGSNTYFRFARGRWYTLQLTWAIV
jgi:hypothetical protein